MVKKMFQNKNQNTKVRSLIEKYNIPRIHLATNRKNIANGLFIGVFIGLIPMPFQMLAVIALIPFFKFNAPIALGTVWISNPFTMPFIYYIEYITGSYLLGMKIGKVELTLKWFSENIKDIFIPLYTGAFLYSLILSVGVYLLINTLWRISVNKERNLKER
ncbi:MAG: DUF2062 domain-containing protein [Sulfurospirillaceae bacterium]|nr:DUF2062 domain-containing protein [Sulfurospirillaceae bacterium]